PPPPPPTTHLPYTTLFRSMYPYHKRYIKNVLLQRYPNRKPEEISIDLNIPLGEALVIYHELKSEKN
ncbi:MAG: hypothetical protein O2U61_03700, partial [Candidatus Bathyarchaeota archaeon]|nr:hypothetical protein [Candidatus Bathyarchaeota archaeon]